MQIVTSRHARRIVLSFAATLTVAVPAHAELFVKETAANLPKYNIYRPADLATRKKPVPVITWINGGCSPRDTEGKALFERWASAGYVVITVNDPDAPARGGPPPGARAGGAPGQPRAMPQLPAGMNPANAIATMLADNPEKQGRALSWAEQENKTKGSPYAGKLDVKRFIAAGNSCGGISSLNFAAKDKRPKAVFVLSGSSMGPMATKEAVAAVMGKITVPTMFVVGGTEDIARSAALTDYENLTPGVAGAVAERATGDHFKLSGDPEVQRDAADMAMLWFRATLYGDKKAASLFVSKGCADCDPKVWPTIKSKNLVRR